MQKHKTALEGIYGFMPRADTYALRGTHRRSPVNNPHVHNHTHTEARTVTHTGTPSHSHTHTHRQHTLTCIKSRRSAQTNTLTYVYPH